MPATIKLYNQKELFSFVLELAQEVKEGRTSFADLGDVNVKEHGELLLLKYTREAQYAGNWTKLEQVSRGLILSKLGEIIAVPYFKFFNWNQYGLKASGNLQTVTKKMDGSLGVVYHYNGKWNVVTGGSFVSDQAVWAQSKLDEYDFSNVSHNLTLMVEIIYPENRFNGPVIDYGDKEELVLLGARSLDTGELLPRYSDSNSLFELSTNSGLPLVEEVEAHNALELIERTGSTFDEEGWVGSFSDGTLFKFKTDWYFEQQRLVGNFSIKNIGKMWVEGRNEIHLLPDEFYDEAQDMVDKLDESYESIIEDSYKDYLLAKDLETRKEQAELILTGSYPRVTFAILDDKDYDKIAKQLVFNQL